MLEGGASSQPTHSPPKPATVPSRSFTLDSRASFCSFSDGACSLPAELSPSRTPVISKHVPNSPSCSRHPSVAFFHDHSATLPSESLYMDHASSSEPPAPASADVARTKVFVCPLLWCGRMYKRMEHLKRHVRSHTMERPFQCHRCNKKFSLQDNLTQHFRIHMRMDAEGAIGTAASYMASMGEDESGHADIEDLDELEGIDGGLLNIGVCEVEVEGIVHDVDGDEEGLITTAPTGYVAEPNGIHSMVGQDAHHPEPASDWHHFLMSSSPEPSPFPSGGGNWMARATPNPCTHSPRQIHNPNNPEIFPTPSMLDPPQQVAGAFPSPNHSDPGSYSQTRQRQHHDENSSASAALTFLERDEANTVPKHSTPPPPQESEGRYNLFAGSEDRQERCAKRQEVTGRSGTSPVAVPAKPSPRGDFFRLPPFSSVFGSSRPIGRFLTSNIICIS
jgi:hypothetical protein